MEKELFNNQNAEEPAKEPKKANNDSDEFNLLKEIMLECGFILSY